MRKAALLVACLFALTAAGDRGPEKREEATLVVTGTITKLETSKAKIGKDGVLTSFTATVKVKKVAKGDKVKAGDTIKVAWRAVTKLPSDDRFAGEGVGYDHEVKAKDEATFWLLGVHEGSWEVIYNINGVEKVKK